MILVDTDVLIAHLRGLEPAAGWLGSARTDGPLAISVVTVAEIAAGMRNAEKREVWGLLSRLEIEPVTEEIARRAGELAKQYRASHSGIGMSDYLIAATVQVGGYELATLNVKHFPMFPGLQPAFTL